MRLLTSVLLLIAFSTLQVPTAVFAQSFRASQSTTTSFDPAVYGLDEDYREIPLLRTEQTLTFVNPDGKFVSIGAGSDLFTYDEDGRLVPIEEKGKKSANGILFDRLPKDIVVHFDPLKPSYVYQKDNHWFRLSYAGEAKAELESPNVVRYRLADHAVLRFTVKGATVSKAITIDGPIDYSVLHFFLETDPDLSVDSSHGGMTLQDATGAPVFQSAPPTLEDAQGNILDHPITIKSLGSTEFVYEYDPTNLPDVYIIDPSTRYKTPNTVVSSGAGHAWTGLTNIAASDNVYASATGLSDSQQLQATNFSFYIADPDATITGIAASIERSNGNPLASVEDVTVRLIKAGTVQGSNYAVTGDWAGDANVIYGSSSDLWGLTFDAASINASNFGIAFAGVCYNSSCDGSNGDAVFRVDQIKIQVFGTFSAGYIAYLESFPTHWENICKVDSLEGIGCWCGYCGSLAVPPGISAVDAMNESIDMTQAGFAGGRLVRFKKGETRIADVPIMFISSGPSCNTLTIDADATERQSLLHGIADYITGTNSGYMLYVTKSVYDDQVRICSGKDALGCTSSDNWSFLANDTGTITETNGGFDASKMSVSITDGYWAIFGLQETGGEGEGGGGGGGASVPEFPFVGLFIVSLACIFFIRWKVLRHH